MAETTWIQDLFMTWWSLQTMNIILCEHMSGRRWKSLCCTMLLFFYLWVVELSTMLYVNHAELRTLGRCSHVVAVLFSILDHIKKDGPMFFLKPCASREFSRNKGKKRNKNPRRVSITKYQNKRKQRAAPVIYLDPWPVEHQQVSPEQINRLVSSQGDMSRNSNGLSMWEIQFKSTHRNYDLGNPSCLQEKVKILCKNLTTSL